MVMTQQDQTAPGLARKGFPQLLLSQRVTFLFAPSHYWPEDTEAEEGEPCLMHAPAGPKRWVQRPLPHQPCAPGGLPISCPAHPGIHSPNCWARAPPRARLLRALSLDTPEWVPQTQPCHGGKCQDAPASTVLPCPNLLVLGPCLV